MTPKELSDRSFPQKPLEHFIALLMRWNKVHNLMSSNMGEADIREHIDDCLIGAKIFEGLNVESIIDLGSGAGFPGVLLALTYAEKKVFLVDSIRKKTMFLSLVRNELKLNNISVLNCRAENIPESLFGENVLLSTRAAFSVDNIGIIIPLIKKCAGIIMWTTAQSSKELEAGFLPHGIHAHKVWDYVLPGSQKSRRVVWFKG